MARLLLHIYIIALKFQILKPKKNFNIAINNPKFEKKNVETFLTLKLYLNTLYVKIIRLHDYYLRNYNKKFVFDFKILILLPFFLLVLFFCEFLKKLLLKNRKLASIKYYVD